VENLVRLPLSQIHEDATLQPRERTYEDLIEDLVELGWFPPIAVATVGGRTVVIDGHHRLAAARRLQWDAIDAQHLGALSPREAWQRAFTSNAVHGRPLSVADKKRHANWLLDHYPHLSDREISSLSFLSEPTTKAMRHGLTTTELQKAKREARRYPLSDLWDKVEAVSLDDFLHGSVLAGRRGGRRPAP